MKLEKEHMKSPGLERSKFQILQGSMFCRYLVSVIYPVLDYEMVEVFFQVE